MLHLFFSANVIKYILYTNGSVVNLGCTKSTNSCKEIPHFDYKFKLRVNTPPCCRKKILKLFEHLTIELQRLRVEHFLIFDGVIGWARNKNIVPYGTALYLVIDGTFWKSKRMTFLMEALLRMHGHASEFRDNMKQWRISYSKQNNNHLDIWPYSYDNRSKNVKVPHFAWVQQPGDYIFPLRNVNFSGIQTFIPSNPEAYLNNQYGIGNWEMELSCKYFVAGRCVRRKKHTKH